MSLGPLGVILSGSCGLRPRVLMFVPDTGDGAVQQRAARTCLTKVLQVKCADSPPVSFLSGRDTKAPLVDDSLPVLDPVPLMILAGDAGDTAAQRFFEEYRDMLPSRVTRIVRGLTSSDLEASEDAVLSLKVTSAMAGATRMERYCRDLQDALAAGVLPDATEVLIRMSKTARLILRMGGTA